MTFSAETNRPLRVSAEEFRRMAAGRKVTGIPRRRTCRRIADRDRPSAELPLTIALPFLPPSVNALFSSVRDRHTGAMKRVLTTKARAVRRLIGALVDCRLDPDGLYQFSVDVYMNAFTKAGKVRKVDLSNRIKFLEDCLCEAMGIDDSRIFRLTLTKRQSKDDRVVVRVERFHLKGDRDAA